MNFDVDARTIFLCRHGSHAYGLNIATSDEDFKGVCIKPREAYFGFTEKFEQMEHMGSKTDGIDKVVYSLDKFMSLAANCNPNIIEVLFVDESDVIKCDEFGQRLRDARDMFISREAKFSFSGYAHAQLKRIKTHRSWLLNPPAAAPERKSFGLSEMSSVSKSELGAFTSMVEQGYDLSSVNAFVSNETLWERLLSAAKYVFGRRVLPSDVVTLFTREKAYQAALTHYGQYLGWVKSRNPARAELEAKFGYDTKHGMHLLRLMLMCLEILLTGKVNVKRLDRERLLGVRYGKVAYDQLIAEAEELMAQCEEAYLTSTLPKKPNFKAIDKFNIAMTTDYLSKFG